MRGKLHTMEACIAAGQKYSTPMLERDTPFREEIAQMKDKEILWYTEVHDARKDSKIMSTWHEAAKDQWRLEMNEL
ncbi:MAG: hypothetical protein ACKO96_33085, partial [Flammeovirgaceae bacterium]